MGTTQINENVIQIAHLVAEKVSSEIEITVALIGLAGVVIGIVLTFVLNLLGEWLKGRPKQKLAEQREALLEKLLNDQKHEWRKLETLSRVIGADENETKRLLIKIEARGSTNKKDVWALILKKPLSAVDDDPK